MMRMVLRQRREKSRKLWGYIEIYVHMLRATRILLGSGIYMNFDWAGVGESEEWHMFH